MIRISKRAARESCVPGNANLLICEEQWYTRGYLPHFDSPDHVQHVTVHLADSLPKSAIQKIDQSIDALPDKEKKIERRRRLHEWIDAGHGSCVLKHAPCAELVQGAFLFFDNQHYRLFAWVVMPNHFHVLFQPINGWALGKIVASWKKFTGRQIKDWVRVNQAVLNPGEENLANREICVPGGLPGNAALPSCETPLWHHEYWDRYIRNERHFRDAVAYIHNNPVKAGLCQNPGDWKWSSAYERRRPN